MVWNAIFINFEVILGPCVGGFFGHQGLTIQFSFGLVSRSRLSPIFESKFGRLGLLILGFRMESFAKMDVEIDFGRFLEALGAVVLIIFM